MSEALAPVPAVDRSALERPGAAVALPEVIVDAGSVAVERFLEFFAAAIDERADARGVRSGGGAVSGVVRGARVEACGRVFQHEGCRYPSCPGPSAAGGSRCCTEGIRCSGDGEGRTAMKMPRWSGVVICVALWTSAPAGAQTPVGALALDAGQGEQYGWAVDYETAAAARAAALGSRRA